MTTETPVNTDVSILDQTCSRFAPNLVTLLSSRRIAALRRSQFDGKCHTLVLSNADEKKLGGAKEVVERARKYCAKSIVIITPDTSKFNVTTELGGRLTRIDLPCSDKDIPPSQQNALLYVTDIIATDIQIMVAADPKTGQLLDLATRVAQSDVTVFINGPTGSGKEVLARQIHTVSQRAGKPFIAINCAAIPENMLEAILFGHEKGAFTGAQGTNKGIIRAADGGTLLLDEISEMPMGLQAKLLRVLQERKVTPIGSQTEIEVDIRVIATSNRDMPAEIAAKRFREDLFYRLNVFPLSTQALCERAGDIPALATSLLRRHAPQRDTHISMISDKAMAKLCAYSWPGNVRELENVMQRALVLYDGETIHPEDIIIDAGQCLLVECSSQNRISESV